jgi:BclB C-terminal domain-containing protein
MSGSGTPSTMTTVLGGINNTVSEIPVDGIGVANNVLPTGGVIDTTNGPSEAESIARDGTLTSISAYASTTTALSLVGSTVALTAQLYESTTPNNTFTQVPGALVTLSPPLSGVDSIGTISSGITTGLAIPVTTQTRMMLVFRADVVAGIDTATTINALTSAGVTIN